MKMNESKLMRDACALSIAALPSGIDSLGALSGRRILASGVTGFFGQWIHAALSQLRSDGIDVHLTRLTRSPARFERAYPHWENPVWTSSVAAQAMDFGKFDIGHFDYGLHMATSSDAATNAAEPSKMMLSTWMGTSGMLDWCQKQGAKMLLVGSGAVYGKRTLKDGAPSEEMTSCSAPDTLDPRQSYGEAKRGAEMLCAVRASQVQTCMVRPFAFLGPYLPLSSHFAAGNFLRDASRGEAIIIKGDGSAVRSFMHPADLAVWLLWLMIHGPVGKSVNIGSDQAIDLAQLAWKIAQMARSAPPLIQGAKSESVDYYVPDISLAHRLGLCSVHDLDFCIQSSLNWLHDTEGFGWDGV